ncbi:N-acetyl-D-Glu racemase DgcA [Beijerinckia sp. L45]|uniref:N-acetyl-D-Glu racemase DgcA n=1 Tax=Beijerinckia sp. L45 TaxID=1641855 RepID=UPI00131BB60B|nr:N-acetyl-D-Glu racemase DgcA [Beijerinckia sp. L45]
MITLRSTAETFPIAGRFVIARGAKTDAHVVVVTLDADGVRGRGECVPYARYGESVAGVLAEIAGIAHHVEAGCDRVTLQTLLPAGAARNAVDCALWDLEAKRSGMPAFLRAGLRDLSPAVTAFTLSVGSPDAMEAAARAANARPLLKIKLAGEGDIERLRAVRAGAPAAKLIVDANEAWAPGDLEHMIAACAEAGVALIEQPLPAGADAQLATVTHHVPICGDESVHDREGLAALRERYDVINIKLDKTGGLTEALALASAAEDLGFEIMVGCMVATSLAMAPAMLLAPRARFVDLDGPLLLAHDRPDGLVYAGSVVHPPAPTLWG